jgi:OOP family OmpA-OmpF porin
MTMINTPPSRNAIVFSLLLMFSVFPYSAHAVDPGGFAGVAIGGASYSDEELINLCGDFGLNCSSNSTATAFKLFGGYRVNPYFAVEAGYADWGEVSVEPVGGAGLTFESKGPYVALMPEIPISDSFSLIGEIGAVYLDANLSARLPFVGEIDSISESVAAPIFGLGAAINLEQVTFRFLWERIDPNETYTLEGFDVSSPKLDLFTISAVIRF